MVSVKMGGGEGVAVESGVGKRGVEEDGGDVGSGASRRCQRCPLDWTRVRM